MLWFLVLACVSLLVFFNTIQYPFVHDDVLFILQNSQIGRLDQVFEIFFPPHNAQALSAGLNSYYRPLLDLLTRLEYYFFGFNASAFHLINIIVHTLNGLLIFSLMLRLKFSRTLAFGISLLFLIHPVQTEAVACISGFSNLACIFFMLMALQGYVRKNYILTFIGFILALFTKELAVVVLPLVILIDWYRQKNDQKMTWIVLAGLMVVFLSFRSMVTGSHLLEDILRSQGEFYLRLLSIPGTILMYLRLIVAPYDLHYYRNTDILAGWGLSFIILSCLLIALVLIVRRWPEIRREVIFGLAWFIICIFPVLNIVPLVNEYSFILTAEHFLYFPMIGIIIVLAVMLRRFLPKNVLLIAFGVIVLGCAVLSIYQNTFWRGEIPLFERMVSFEKNFGRGHILLAKAYYADQKIDLAIKHYNRALEIMKSYEIKASNIIAKNFYRRYIQEINSDLAVCFSSRPQAGF